MRNKKMNKMERGKMMGKIDELFVSEENKVSVEQNEEKENYNNLNSFIKSSVVNISISDWFLNDSSSDQIGAFLRDNDKAKYGSSLVSSVSCGESLLACDKSLEYFCFERVLIDLLNKANKNSNSDLSISENSIILSLFSNNSFNTKSGEISLHSVFNNSSITYLLIDSDLKNENSIEASTINDFGSIFNYNAACFLATSCLSSSVSSEICSSVNLLLDNISSASENSNLLTNCLTTLAKANSNLSLSAGCILTFIDSSSILTNNREDLDYLSFSIGKNEEQMLVINKSLCSEEESLSYSK